MKVTYSELQIDAINKISNFDLKVKNIAEGFMIGIHKSPYHGFSVDFSEHRQYYPGDPIKLIDWKIVAKSERYFIKQFDEETNLNAYLILDCSNSMNYTSDKKKYFSKLEYAKLLAGSIAYILNKQRDAISFTAYSNQVENFIPPKAAVAHYFEILKNIYTTKPNGTSDTYKALIDVLNVIKKAGLVIIFSDLLDDPENIIKFVKLVRSKKNEVIVFQILDNQEINFNFGSDKMFIDLETKEKLQTTPLQIEKEYKNVVDEFINKLKTNFAKFDVEYELLTTSTPFDIALFSFLKKRTRLL
ncbi:MAG TPA: DUF58 domain-containing protein [Ignavibacteriales bacterium]|nr:DUF58 domain-containing protein [Ignavibacteriales bacterium]HOL81328.1 DUF58 domain-containing protein [Ignavibacteriales bacterium]HOM65444.1 DUF58 domain-containing protein [Ignavibacteriales bacterium]HPD68298.1 DUF58 domain-containing protein [Ignavibacteriales bacterium]HPP33903.1 DUF58 domain-containing protein [Ignavibacteriales bacterium]